jgi:hypothetical protein
MLVADIRKTYQIDPRVGLKGAVRGKNVLITGGGRGLGKARACMHRTQSVG